MLEINNLSVKVIDKDDNILNKLNLSIGEGEIHAIMGPNGTGKSTLAKTIMGHYQYEVTDGKILFEGKDNSRLFIGDAVYTGGRVFYFSVEANGVRHDWYICFFLGLCPRPRQGPEALGTRNMVCILPYTDILPMACKGRNGAPSPFR